MGREGDGRERVIYVTRLDGSKLVINAELIEMVEQRPDTVVSLTTGHKLVVQQSAEEIIERVIAYRRRIAGCKVERSEVGAER